METLTVRPETVSDGRYQAEELLTRPQDADEQVFATAWRVRDTETEEPAFMKLKNPAADEYAGARVQREADVLGYLSHPQIPELLAAEPDAEIPYIVTELKPGRHITGEEVETTCSDKLAAVICVSALEVLGHVHDAGIIHRDVKISNILMQNNGVANLIDFELSQYRDQDAARAVHQDDAPYHPLRVEGCKGVVMGSPRYMSPEQTHGAFVGPASDIYSMGIVLYKLLYNRHVFTSRDMNHITVQRACQEVDFSPPEDKEIPEGLVAVIRKAMQDRPEDRYQSAGDMREALEASMYSGEDGHRGGLALRVDRFIHQVRA
jgi:serine/threonine protein kinase